MAPQGFLFVNKHSNSPSLSRNTGCEASLASKVNKHVQQQRFWKSSGPRKNWYRPFVRSDSSGPPSPSESSFYEEVTDIKSEHSSPERRLPASLAQGATEQERSPSTQGPIAPRRRASTRQPPRSVPESLVRRHAVQNTVMGKQKPQDERTPIGVDPTTILSSRPGDINDPFNCTIVQITPELRDVLDRHLRWAVSSAVSDFAIKEGVQRIITSVLTDRMHSTAFLAMATAQQKRTSDIVLPHDHSPEYYSYCATKIIREYIAARPGEVEPYTFVDIFRLAMCEWLSGNHKAARIHFSYIARNYNNFKPHNAAEWHSIEVISTEDLFLAVDVDEKPLLSLTWEPELAAGPRIATSVVEDMIRSSIGSIEPDRSSRGPSAVRKRASSPKQSSGLIAVIPQQSLLRPPMQKLLISLQSFPKYSQIDFGSATTGELWIMKRRIHATLHRIQSMQTVESSVEECVKRTLLILLFLASTTPARRLGRTDVPRLAVRLKDALVAAKAVRSQQIGGPACSRDTNSTMQPKLYLWMLITGLVAAKEGPVNEELLQWFSKRVVISALQVCGPQPMSEQVNAALEEYLTFSNVHGNIVEETCTNIGMQIERSTRLTGGFRVVDGPL